MEGFWLSGKLFSPEHCNRMGSAIWLYMYFVREADPATGVVTGFRPEDAAEAIGAHLAIIKGWLSQLVEHGYIERSESPDLSYRIPDYVFEPNWIRRVKMETTGYATINCDTFLSPKLIWQEKLMYATLCAEIDPEDEEGDMSCNTSIETFAEMTGLSWHAVHKALRGLEEKKVIEVIRQKGPAGYRFLDSEEFLGK